MIHKKITRYYRATQRDARRVLKLCNSAFEAVHHEDVTAAQGFLLAINATAARINQRPISARSLARAAGIDPDLHKRLCRAVTHGERCNCKRPNA